MKKLWSMTIALAVVLGLFGHAAAANFEFHGDLNHRFQFTNRADFLTLDGTGVINDGDVYENFGEIKYRLWMDAATNNGDVKGHVATEIGGLRFGESGKADFSGDDIQFEVRWAYTDVQLPMVDRRARFKIGLQPFTVNRYLWWETTAGVAFNSTIGDNFDYTLAWMRGAEYDKTAQGSNSDDDRSDLDSFLVRLNMDETNGVEANGFVLYQGYDADGFGNAANPLDSRSWQVKRFNAAGDPRVDFNLWSLGLNVSFEFGNFFVNGDAIYQTGKFENLTFNEFFTGTTTTDDFDLSAYFLHVDAGAVVDKSTFTYTFWYASGDDNPADDQFDAYISTDVDTTDSIALFEGNYADDNYFTERPYLADKGFIMNRLGVDYGATSKLTLGAALMYMMTAEDIRYTAAATGTSESNNELGWETDAYVKYMLFPNVEVAASIGYLFAGDALDAYEAAAIQDGQSDENIWILSSRLRYKF